MLKKVTYILSNTDRAIVFEWIIQKMNRKEFDISFIHLNDKPTYLHNWLINQNIESYYVPHFGKKSYPKSFFYVLKTLKKINPDIVHTHLFDANLIGLFCSKLLRVPKRVYTRHHSTYHHDYFPKAVKYDRWNNNLSTDIVAISKNVKLVLEEKEKVHQKKTHLVPHGFDLTIFQTVSALEIKLLKEKYRINSSPVVGVIARYVKWKGIQYIISAFKEVLIKYPKAILIIANAQGPYKEQITKSLSNLPKNSYREIGYEPNFPALYQLFDVYVHVPIDKSIEAYGQTYIEALASGIPSVFTLSGIANEFIKNNENAIVVPYKSSKKIKDGILTLLQNEEYKNQLIKAGRKSIQKFNLTLFIERLEALYKN